MSVVTPVIVRVHGPVPMHRPAVQAKVDPVAGLGVSVTFSPAGTAMEQLVRRDWRAGVTLTAPVAFPESWTVTAIVAVAGRCRW